MELKTGEHYRERATGREYVLLNIAEHADNTWLAFANLETRKQYTQTLAKFEQDFEPAASQP